MRRLSILLAVSVAAALPGAARGADAASGTTQPKKTRDAAPKPRTEEIVVTAQKRSENVRKVPLSVTVLSGAQIRQQHIQNFTDLAQAVPNLSFSSQAGEGLSTLELRGIASTAGTATVAIYLDDVSLTTRNIFSAGTTEPRFLDIARVEVLRGPQGTLYGASALGGTLKYISNSPQLDKYEGSIFSELSGTYHGNVNWDEQGVINIPLVPGQAALRIAAETGGDSGYVNLINPNTGGTVKADINSLGYDDARATLLWTPTDWLTITPMIFWQRANQRDVDAQYTELPKFQTPKPVAEPGKDNVIVPSLTMNADLSFANLVSITSNYERQFPRTLDSTIYNNLSLYLCSPENADFLDCPNGYTAPPGAPPGLYDAIYNLPSYTYYDTTVRQWSQEVRLVSRPYVPGGLPFTWLAGLYYSDEHTVATDTETIQNLDQIFQRYGVSPNDPNVVFGSFPGAIENNYVYRGIRGYDTSQYAVFGEGTYYPQPNIRLTVGARYLYARDGLFTSEKLFYDYGRTGITTSVGHYYAFTPKFAGGWDVTKQDTLYFNVTKGFRLGSENRQVPFVPGEENAFGTPTYDLTQLGLKAAPVKYGPDKLWNFEIGDKSRWYGGRLLLSADVFYINWTGIQEDVPLTTSGQDFETNAGSAQNWGGEFELRGRPTENLTLGLAGAYTHARLDKGVVINGNLVAGTFPGERVPGVPEYNIDASARQDFTINDRTTGWASIDIPWVGDSIGNVINTNPDYKRPSYATINANAGIDFGRYEFTIFGRNLTNNNKIIQRPDIQGSAVDGYGLNYLGSFIRNLQGFTLRPLTVGVNATVKF